MKINIFKIITLLAVVLSGVECIAQSGDYYNENLRRIDAYVNGPIKAYNCEGGMIFPAKYKTSKIRSDLSLMSFINSLFSDKTIKPDVETRIGKVKKKSIRVVKSLNGLIESYDITMPGKYLRVNAKFDFIDSVLVRSKVALRTTTHGECGSHNHMLDFKLVRVFFIKDAKVLFEVGYDEMTSDTIYSGNLTSLAKKRNDYKFNIPGSVAENWVNELFTKQYQTDSSGVYEYSQAPKSFARLIKENKASVIEDLLYSPNYITSVNAMEALIYLASTGRIKLTPEVNSRIAQVKDGAFIIIQQGAPDVLYRREGYKELQMTDEKVIKKYESSL